MRIEIKTVLIKPLIAAVLCGGAAYGSYNLLCGILTFGDPSSRLNGQSLSCLVSVGVAGVVYLICILFTKTLVKDDILMLPKGEKLAKILEKYKLIG